MTASRYVTIDGMKIQGGDQQGFPNNLQTGSTAGVCGRRTGRRVSLPRRRPGFMRITNNIQSNGGAYAGAIRLGTPHPPGA